MQRYNPLHTLHSALHCATPSAVDTPRGESPLLGLFKLEAFDMYRKVLLRMPSPTSIGPYSDHVNRGRKTGQCPLCKDFPLFYPEPSSPPTGQAPCSPTQGQAVGEFQGDCMFPVSPCCLDRPVWVGLGLSFYETPTWLQSTRPRC